MIEITSRHNPEFKQLQDLHKREVRDQLGCFIVEGEKELSMGNPSDFQVVFTTEKSFFIQELIDKKVKVILIPPQLFEKVSYRDQGVLAVVNKKKREFQEARDWQFFLVVDQIEKPGNLGAILRSVDAVGMDGIIVTDPRVDIYNPNVARASLGAILQVNILKSTREEVIAFLEQKKIQTIITTPHADKLYYEIDYRKPTCIVIGSESEGLSKDWMAHRGFTPVKIPMKGRVDSLNASVATSICLYEAVRQRSTLPR